MTPRRVPPLVAWVALAAAAGALGAWGAASASAGTTGEEPPARATTRGDTLYTVHCARCHGADGTGGLDGRAPALVGMEVARVDLALRTNRMPPARPDGTGTGDVDWDERSREILVAHLTAVFDLEGGVPVPQEGDAAVGREVFATHCAACHGYTGDGGVAGAGALTPRLLGLDPVTMAEAIRMGPFQMPRFVEEQISDSEIDHIIAYLDEVATEPATPFGFVELNPVFLSAFVGLLALAAVLSCLYIAGRVTMFPDPQDTPEADGEDHAESGGGP